MSIPMRRIRLRDCARAASGHAAALPRTLMNSRRLMCSPHRPRITSYHILEKPCCASQLVMGGGPAKDAEQHLSNRNLFLPLNASESSANSALLLNNLVGEREQFVGDLKVKRLR